MTAISDRELLAVWEAAQAAPSVFRPAELLRAAGDDAPEKLPIGVRDRRILALRQRWFGTAFEALVDCPHCASPVELTFDGSALDSLPQGELTGTIGEVAFRFPDTTDLAAIRNAIDLADARALLAKRCIVSGAADEETFDAVARALASADPAADLTVGVTCPECGAAWEAAFDPAAYLLRELDGAAMRILREIDALAVAYGWTEGEILSLSRTRRRTYLRMVTQ